MASVTPTLEYTRFVRQVSNGFPHTKYSYLAMQAELLAKLKVAAWKAADCSQSAVTTVVNKITETDRVVDDSGNVTSDASYTAYIDDKYDVYKQGGDADKSAGTMCGYAGMVAYRFTLPTEIMEGTEFESVLLSALSIPIQASRYLRSGLRVVVATSGDMTGDEYPPTDWDFLRGDAASITNQTFARIAVSTSTASTATGVASWGVGGQSDVATLMASKPQEFTFEATPGVDVNSAKYLWVFLSIEDYTDYWELYDAKTPRYYSIEGSAILMPDQCVFTFSESLNDTGGGGDGTCLLESRSVVLGSYPVSPFEIPVSETVAAAYGSMVYARGVSRIIAYTPHYATLLKALQVASAKFMFDHTWSTVNDYSADDSDGNFKVDEMGVLASVRLSASVANTRGIYLETLLDYTHRDLTPAGTTESEAFNAASHMSICYGAVSVPMPWVAGTRAYSNSIILMPQANDGLLVQGCNASILAWRTKSPAALNAFADAAIATLASKRAFFTGESKTISGTFVGDGTFTSSLEFTVEADLIGQVSLKANQLIAQADMTNSTYAYTDRLIIPLQKSVEPGEIVILVPRIDEITADTTAATGNLQRGVGLYKNTDDTQYSTENELHGWAPYVSFC